MAIAHSGRGNSEKIILIDGKIQSEGAYITFWKTGIVDHNPYESWLVSPTLSYKQAASKILTFSLRFNGLSKDEQREELFQAYIITEKMEFLKNKFSILTSISQLV